MPYYAKARRPGRFAFVRRALPIAGGLAVLAAVGAPAVVGFQTAGVLENPPPFDKPDSPARYHLAPAAIAVHTPRLAAPLKGWLFENPAANGRAVLFLHGWRSHRQHMLKNYLSWLARRYTVLAFDHPGHGESPRGPVTLGDLEREDAQAALAILHQRGYHRVGVMGVSMGGTTAIGLAAESPDVKAVVSEGTYAHMGDLARGYFTSHGYPFPALLAQATDWALALRAGRNLDAACAERQIARLAPRPIFLIHGTNDHVVSADDARELFAAARGPKELWLVPGADHVSDDRLGPHAKDPAEYERRVEAFFDRTL